VTDMAESANSPTFDIVAAITVADHLFLNLDY